MIDLNTSLEWKKMKFQALRNELSSRGLDTVGVKSTLVERLEDFSSTVTDGSDHEAAAGKTKEAELEDIQAKLPSEPQSEPAIKPVVAKDIMSAATFEATHLLVSKSLEEGKTKPAKALELHDAEKVASHLTNLEKKQKRAERFGTALKITEDEKRSMRSARFNGATANGAKRERGSESINEGSGPATAAAEAAKRKARAERFGNPRIGAPETAMNLQVSADEEAKKKARLARFATAWHVGENGVADLNFN